MLTSKLIECTVSVYKVTFTVLTLVLRNCFLVLSVDPVVTHGCRITTPSLVIIVVVVVNRIYHPLRAQRRGPDTVRSRGGWAGNSCSPPMPYSTKRRPGSRSHAPSPWHAHRYSADRLQSPIGLGHC